MVCDKLHIICGNCGHYLKEYNLGSWEYIAPEFDEEGIITEADVFIKCENCDTIHSLSKYLQEKIKKETTHQYHKSHCTHCVLGECSQNHHNNCVGTDKCIKDLETKLNKIQEYIDNNLKIRRKGYQFEYANNCKNLLPIKVFWRTNEKI